jgi:Tfp pilus assembly protein PilF
VANHALSQDDLQKMTPRVQDPAVAECVALGHKAATEGNFDQAIKLFSACIEKHPNSTDAHFFLGMAYFYKQDIDKAAGELRKSLQYDSNNLDASAMLGRIYSFDKQKLALSRELLERVISAAPYKDDVRFDLAGYMRFRETRRNPSRNSVPFFLVRPDTEFITPNLPRY